VSKTSENLTPGIAKMISNIRRFEALDPHRRIWPLL
jgi:hypothetical protein